MMDLYEIPVEEFGDLINAQKHGITRAFQMYTDDMDKELKCVYNDSPAQQNGF
jgi:hypothetical protein